MNGMLIESEMVQSCAFFSSWLGLASPPFSAEAFDLVRRGEQFLLSRRDSLDWKPIQSDKVCGLLSALLQPITDGPPREVFWTDDYPQFRLRVVLTDGDVLVADSHSQAAGMVPWEFRRRADATHFTSYNADLGPAIAAILPESALNRGRLARTAIDQDAGVQDFLESHFANEFNASESGRRLVRANDRDKPLFHLGWEHQPIQSLRTLLSQGADVNAQDHLGQTALVIACRYRKHFLVQPLLEAGADPNLSADNGATALYYVCCDAKTPDDLEIIKQLISAGANVHSCLEVVLQSNSRVSAMLTNIILGAGGNLETRDSDGRTGLMRSVDRHDHEVFVNWIRAGADVNARTQSGQTVLMQALRSPEKMEVLINAGADVNVIDPDGRTALIHAAKSRSAPAKIIQILLSAGADPSVRDLDGHSALDYATEMESLLRMQAEVKAEFTHSGLDERPPDAPEEFAGEELERVRAVRQLLW